MGEELKILEGFYGRHEGTGLCGPASCSQTAKCEGKIDNNVTSKIKASCAKTGPIQSCQIPACRSTLGVKSCNKVASGTTYLEASYQCKKHTAALKSAPPLETNAYSTSALLKPHTVTSIITDPRAMGMQKVAMTWSEDVARKNTGWYQSESTWGKPCLRVYQDQAGNKVLEHSCATGKLEDAQRVLSCSNVVNGAESCNAVLDQDPGTSIQMSAGGSITIQYPTKRDWTQLKLFRPPTGGSGQTTTPDHIWHFKVECHVGANPNAPVWEVLFDTKTKGGKSFYAGNVPGVQVFPLGTCSRSTDTWRINGITPSSSRAKFATVIDLDIKTTVRRGKKEAIALPRLGPVKMAVVKQTITTTLGVSTTKHQCVATKKEMTLGISSMCDAVNDGDVNSPVIFTRSAGEPAEPQYTAQFGRSRNFRAVWIYWNPAFSGKGTHQRLRTFDVECYSDTQWRKVLDQQTDVNRKQFDAVKSRDRWIVLLFDDTTCMSQRWRVSKMNNAVNGDAFIFEMKFVENDDPLPVCDSMAAAFYTRDTPCLPKPKPARVQGWCVHHQHATMNDSIMRENSNCKKDECKWIPGWCGCRGPKKSCQMAGNAIGRKLGLQPGRDSTRDLFGCWGAGYYYPMNKNHLKNEIIDILPCGSNLVLEANVDSYAQQECPDQMWGRKRRPKHVQVDLKSSRDCKQPKPNWEYKCPGLLVDFAKMECHRNCKGSNPKKLAWQNQRCHNYQLPITPVIIKALRDAGEHIDLRMTSNPKGYRHDSLAWQMKGMLKLTWWYKPPHDSIDCIPRKKGEVSVVTAPAVDSKFVQAVNGDTQKGQKKTAKQVTKKKLAKQN